MNARTCRILFLSFGTPRAPRQEGVRFDPVLGVLAAVLREQGHEISLLPIKSFDPDPLRERIRNFGPDLLYAQVAPTCPDLARRTLGHIEQRYGLHAVAGGVFATVEPDAALSFPGVQAIVVGEPERALPAYVVEHLTGEPGDPIPGIWYRNEHGTVRTEPHPLTGDLDSLPFAERGIFENGDHSGGQACRTVSVGRGCPLRCGYCFNDRLAEMYAGRGDFVRRRSPEEICDEIDALCLAHPETERIRFEGHLFALDEQWLEGFASVYARRCGIPFECHVRSQAVSERVAELLAQAGCALAEIHIVSESDFVRNEILTMDVSDHQLVAAFDRLRVRGIRTRAVSLVGAPYSTEVSLSRLVKLVDRLQASEHDVRVFYPLPGTTARQLCSEKGWLSNRGEENFLRQHSVLDMPGMPAASIDRLARVLGSKQRMSPGARLWYAMRRRLRGVRLILRGRRASRLRDDSPVSSATPLR